MKNIIATLAAAATAATAGAAGAIDPADLKEYGPWALAAFAYVEVRIRPLFVDLLAAIGVHRAELAEHGKKLEAELAPAAAGAKA